MRIKQFNRLIAIGFLSGIFSAITPVFFAQQASAQQAPAPDSITLQGTARDFKGKNQTGGHPDFEGTIATEKNLVTVTLGTDKKPIYNEARSPKSTTITGKNTFDQWFRDVSGVNQTMTVPLTLTKDAQGNYTYYNPSFFILDGKLFGNTPGQSRNYHFTYEAHTKFTYKKGQTFEFKGDDDVWVFINNKLVVDLGGVHSELTGSVNLDTLGLTEGQTYDFDIYFAERHTTASNFKIQTSIAFDPVVVTIDSLAATKDTTPLINGSSPNLSGATNGATKITVAIDFDRNGTIDATYVANVGTDGRWSIDLSKPPTSGTVPDLSNGDKADVTVTATDAQNRQSAPAKQQLVIDTKAPNPPVVTTSTNSGTPTSIITGTAEPNSSIEVKVGNISPTIKTSADATGRWTIDLKTITPEVPPATYTVTATAIDAAGNKSRESDPTKSLKIDTKVLTTTAKVTQKSQYDNKPTFSGTVTLTGGVVNTGKIVLKNGQTTVAENISVQNGTWTSSTTNPMAPGTYDKFTVTYSDGLRQSTAPVPTFIILPQD